MRLLKRLCVLLSPLVLPLGGCHKQGTHSPTHPTHVHYVIGSGWQGASVWFYPRERFALNETGLAVRLAAAAGTPMADGMIYDPAAMVGAHQTLQLPSIVVVRNLETGRSGRLRLDGRGPDDPGRILAVSPKVAELLGMGAGAARVQIEEDEAASRALAEAMPDGPHLALTAAPVGAVVAQSLGPVPQAGHAIDIAEGSTSLQNTAFTPLAAVAVQGPVQQSALWIEVGRFAGASIASQAARRCHGVALRRSGSDQGLDWLVRRGPYEDVTIADQALRETFACGMPAARIIVE